MIEPLTPEEYLRDHFLEEVNQEIEDAFSIIRYETRFRFDALEKKTIRKIKNIGRKTSVAGAFKNAAESFKTFGRALSHINIKET